jgi:Fe-S-cluster containining protein
MAAPDNSTESIVVNGIAIDRKLLETRAACRCVLEQCEARCCGGGVAIHLEQVNDILAHQEQIRPHLAESDRDPAAWFDQEFEVDHDHPAGGTCVGTKVVADPTHPDGERCVFLRRDRKCALQAAGIAAGGDPWRFKPFYCALFPLVFDRKRLVLDEQNEVYTGGGNCQRPSSGERVPVYRLFDAETKLALGEKGFAELDAYAQAEAKRRERPSAD